jgi:hypothetical protein
MSAGKHTPGPWKAGSRSVTALETEDRLGMDVRLYGGSASDNRANARLIAAAPDLLEALQPFMALEPELWSDIRVKRAFVIARTAIAKATGKQ